MGVSRFFPQLSGRELAHLSTDKRSQQIGQLTAAFHGLAQRLGTRASAKGSKRRPGTLSAQVVVRHARRADARASLGGGPASLLEIRSLLLI